MLVVGSAFSARPDPFDFKKVSTHKVSEATSAWCVEGPHASPTQNQNQITVSVRLSFCFKREGKHFFRSCTTTRLALGLSKASGKGGREEGKGGKRAERCSGEASRSPTITGLGLLALFWGGGGGQGEEVGQHRNAHVETQTKDAQRPRAAPKQTKKHRETLRKSERETEKETERDTQKNGTKERM